MSTELHIGEIWNVPHRPPVGERGEAALMSHTAMVVRDGRILALGDRTDLSDRYPDSIRIDHGDALLLPGFVDAHTHFPQIDVIGSYGGSLLGWLASHTYPREATYADPQVAAPAAARFVSELLANGVTAAGIYASSHEAATRALFIAAEHAGIRAVIGKVSMDRDAPSALLSSTRDDLAANERLIRDWHGRDERLYVALTPRFALSCSEDLLAALGDLKRRHPSLYVQTHHAETLPEIAAVACRFPDDPHYLGVYDRHGLLGPHTILGHVIHATPAEIARIAATGTKVAHCPTSNLFLGSGLLPLRSLLSSGVEVALATDVGGGTSFSMLQTMNEAYKVQALRGDIVSPVQLLYMATQAGAAALGMGDRIGALAPGKAADFQVLDWRRSRLLSARFQEQAAPFARLMALIMLGDDRLTRAVYVAGREVYANPAA